MLVLMVLLCGSPWVTAAMATGAGLNASTTPTTKMSTRTPPTVTPPSTFTPTIPSTPRSTTPTTKNPTPSKPATPRPPSSPSPSPTPTTSTTASTPTTTSTPTTATTPTARPSVSTQPREVTSVSVAVTSVRTSLTPSQSPGATGSSGSDHDNDALVSLVAANTAVIVVVVVVIVIAAVILFRKLSSITIPPPYRDYPAPSTIQRGVSVTYANEDHSPTSPSDVELQPSGTYEPVGPLSPNNVYTPVDLSAGGGQPDQPGAERRVRGKGKKMKKNKRPSDEVELKEALSADNKGLEPEEVYQNYTGR